ncbi:MAG: hypothetical protein HRU36_03145 [Rickettsiales bacterium]|nr:hypothetical protein [Rickettsiales bacterium]
MKKDKITSIRLNTKEFDYLVERATKNGLTLGEYIRLRVFEDLAQSETNIELEHKRDMTAFTAYSFFLLKALAQKHLKPEEIDNAKNKMLHALEDYKMNARK